MYRSQALTCSKNPPKNNLAGFQIPAGNSSAWLRKCPRNVFFFSSACSRKKTHLLAKKKTREKFLITFWRMTTRCRERYHMTANGLRYLLESVFVTLLFRLVFYGSPDNINIFLCFFRSTRSGPEGPEITGKCRFPGDRCRTSYWMPQYQILADSHSFGGKKSNFVKKNGHILQNIQFRWKKNLRISS